ncbi:uncharacterized protein LOC125495591 [Beta vulgaris subsp. vulgaris]|uniref:uncharacterized protein LOC125495591 n=1 Tax=Beta vulgaris subsp. vulgaris TaxID=3555 RepID=UPI002036F19D|nr:uncharacterized protein LOC125495591 [Beta vulgaris subsp. vulgaris]
MADEILNKVSNLKITEAENQVISFDEGANEDDNHDLALSLVGRVLTVRSYNFEALKRTLNQIWAISNGALFRSIENGFFVVQFANLRDKTKVLNGRPWTFDQNLILLSEIEGELQPSNMSLTLCPFWLRIYNLPMAYRTEKHIKMIANSMGEVLEYDSDGILWDKSARIRVLLDVTKPLRRIQRISLKKGEPVMVEIKYERLPTFCYVCGIIGHIERDCWVHQEEEKEIEKQWGSWLRASPRKGRIKMEEETRAFLSCARNLTFANTKAATVEEAPICETEQPSLSFPLTNDSKQHGVSGSVHLPPITTPTPPGESGQNVVATPHHVDTFVFNVGPKPVKTTSRKHKIKARVVPMEINESVTVETNVHGHNLPGDKRKFPDPMVVNDDTMVESVNVKKMKLDDSHVPGSVLVTVEAEVGSTQPRPAL